MKNDKLKRVGNIILFFVLVFAIISNVLIGIIDHDAYHISFATLLLVINNFHFNWD